MIIGQFGSLAAALTAAGGREPAAARGAAANFVGPEAALDAIRQWVGRCGAVPALADWDPARARHLGQDWRIARSEKLTSVSDPLEALKAFERDRITLDGETVAGLPRLDL